MKHVHPEAIRERDRRPGCTVQPQLPVAAARQRLGVHGDGATVTTTTDRSLTPDDAASSGSYIDTVPAPASHEFGQATAARRIRASRRERRLLSDTAPSRAFRESHGIVKLAARVCDIYVGANPFLLVAGSIWKFGHNQMGISWSALRTGHAAPEQAVWTVVHIQIRAI